jgi:hypothetical protein
MRCKSHPENYAIQMPDNTSSVLRINLCDLIFVIT